MDTIESIIRDAADRITTVVRTNIFANLGDKGKGGKVVVLKNGKTRKKGPVQLCPVPGCNERAAPSLGMVCAEHKGLSKTKIKQYREARRVAKARPKAKA